MKEKGKTALRIHKIIPFSASNGPGIRTVIWIQGCSLRCPGCYNPKTHSLTGGKLITIDDLFSEVTKIKGKEGSPKIEGISISGGEPLDQFRPLLVLLKRIRRDTGLSVLVFTGYTMEQVKIMPSSGEFLRLIDVLVAGPYDLRKRLGSGLRGSSNQGVYFLSGRYCSGNIENVPEGEIIITEKGEVFITGINPPLL